MNCINCKSDEIDFKIRLKDETEKTITIGRTKVLFIWYCMDCGSELESYEYIF